MKTKALMTAIATIALLMPGTAMASNHKKNHEVKPKHHRIERRMHVAHRPEIGKRFHHRPANGKFIIVNRERMWVADGILYRMISTRTGTVFVVAGYLR